jgi:ATP-dependent RNA helicase RhlE
MTFEDLNLIPPILQALKEQGYTEPTPIQAQAIPLLLQGRDLLGCAQTGTGKTCAFAVPILQMLHPKVDTRDRLRKIKALIVTPTRELAIQIDESFREYGKHLGLTHTVIFGGVKQGAQTHALQKGIDILTATPGRLLDLMQQGFISLSNVEFFVLDEADRMLDMGFIHDVRKVIAKLPAKRQSLYFSATMPQEIVELSAKILSNPAKVSVKPETTTAERVDQAVYHVDHGNKNALLIHLLKDPEISRVLVFTRTKHGANKVVKVLNKAGIGAEAIHGNKSQNARQQALEGFKNGDLRVLVATDIAARGIDIDSLSHVIQFDLPNIPETYVHRIGRTGRAGMSGIALSFCEAEERPYLRDIQRLIRQELPVITNHPYLPGTQIQKVEASDWERPPMPPRGQKRNQPAAKPQGQPRNVAQSAPRPQSQPRTSNEQAQGGSPESVSAAARKRRKRGRGGRGAGPNANANGGGSAPVARQANSQQPPRRDGGGNSGGGFRGGVSWD